MKIPELTKAIIQKSSEVPATRSMLVGVSGIDASGKGFTAKLLSGQLEDQGLIVALINVDGWLELPHMVSIAVIYRETFIVTACD